jgi:hypothetical protein
MGLMYDFTFTVTNTGSQTVDVTGKGPMESFGPIMLPPGSTYVHEESVDVCGLGSLTVYFTAMGDGGDCYDEVEVIHTFIPPAAETLPPVTSPPTSTPTVAPTSSPTAPPTAICTIEVCSIVYCTVIFSSNNSSSRLTVSSSQIFTSFVHQFSSCSLD